MDLWANILHVLRALVSEGLLPCSRRASWGFFSSCSQQEEDSGVSLASLKSWRSGKGECAGGGHIFSKPSCLSFSVFSSPMPGSSDGGVNKGAMPSGRCSPVTSSTSSEFGGEAGLKGWIGASGCGSVVFLFNKI